MTKSRKKYRTIKVHWSILDGAEYARAQFLARRENLKKLKPVLAPNRCPICGGELSELEVKAKIRYVQCKRCGYKQPSISVETSGTDVHEFMKALGIGVLVGLGLAALVYLLTHGSEG